jgi:protein tyrosine/serine phosphatase
LIPGCAVLPEENTGKTVIRKLPENFHTVNKNIFRSGQPTEEEFASLYIHYGVRSVLNLRMFHSDKKSIEAVNQRWRGAIRLYEIPLISGFISENDLYNVLSVIRDAPKPLLIHCQHGSNRTGCTVAASRIVFDNWNVEAAIAELSRPEYGHRKYIYRNIPKLLRKTDWKRVKTIIIPPEISTKNDR